MLVFPASPPPFTSTRPSTSMAVPGQNMSCPVSVTLRWLTAFVAGSYVAVSVAPLPPVVYGSDEDQVSSRPVGSSAAATGISGKLTGALHRPMLAGGAAAAPSRLISAALLHWPRRPASDSAVSRTYRAGTAGNVTVFRAESSSQVPAERTAQVLPSVLVSTRYEPIAPLRPVAAGRGR